MGFISIFSRSAYDVSHHQSIIRHSMSNDVLMKTLSSEHRAHSVADDNYLMTAEEKLKN